MPGHQPDPLFIIGHATEKDGGGSAAICPVGGRLERAVTSRRWSKLQSLETSVENSAQDFTLVVPARPRELSDEERERTSSTDRHVAPCLTTAKRAC